MIPRSFALSRRLVVAVLWCASATGATDTDWRVRATAEGSIKHNSNLTLVDDEVTDPKDAPLAALDGSLTARGVLAGWRVDSEVSGLANLHTEHADENWFFLRSRLGMRRQAGPGSAEATNETRYYTIPDQDDVDFVRNVLQLAYRRGFRDDRWQVRGGYANIHTRYPNQREFDYTVHGLLLEGRRRWGYDLTASLQIDIQRYIGTATPTEVEASPRDGQRYGLRFGVDGLMAGRHSYSLIYSFQMDEADLGVKRIGDPENPESTQDIEAEFDLDKHKVTLHYGVPIGRRWLVASYTEWIHKLFDDEIDVQIPFRGRRDTLLLHSLLVRYRLDDTWSLKLRHLYRANDSNIARADYTAHLVSAGIAARF